MTIDIERFQQPEDGSSRPFSRAVRAGNMVFISSHSAPHDPENGINRGDTPADEVKNALEYIAKLLKEAGSSFDQIVQVTMLIGEKPDYAELNAEYVKHFPMGLPSRHTALFGVPTDARVGCACVAVSENLAS